VKEIIVEDVPDAIASVRHVLVQRQYSLISSAASSLSRFAWNAGSEVGSGIAAKPFSFVWTCGGSWTFAPPGGLPPSTSVAQAPLERAATARIRL